MTLEVGAAADRGGGGAAAHGALLLLGRRGAALGGLAQYVIAAQPDEVARTRLCHEPRRGGGLDRGPQRGAGGRPPELTAEVRALIDSGEVPYTANVLEEVLAVFGHVRVQRPWGAPSVWLYRVNMGGMRHFHHSYLDDLAGVSARQIARAASLSARLVHDAATREPYHPRTIQPDLEKTIRKHAEVYYGW